MARPAKANTEHSRLRTFISSKRMRFFVPVVIFALIGAYIIFTASAGENFSGNETVDPPVNFTSLAVGDSFTMLSRGEVYAGIKPYQVLIDFRYNPAIAKLVDIKCETSLGCYRSLSSGYVNSETASHRYQTGFVVCIDAKNADLSSYTNFFSMSFIKLSTQNDSGYAIPGHLNWWSATLGAAPGSCNNNRTANGVEWLNGSGNSCNASYVNENGAQYGTDPACDNGEGIGDAGFTGFNGFTDAGQNSQGKTNTGTSAGGGGGGGASANKQSNTPNNIPSSSAQGDEANPELDPSPFFDGKEYKQGSDGDNLAGTFASTGKRLVNKWYAVVAALVLGGITGFIAWKWKWRRR